MPFGFAPRAAAALMGLAAFAGSASAGPITYSITLSPMTVVFQNQSFDDASITFTIVGDTDDVQGDQGNYIFVGDGRFSIDGGPGGEAGSLQIGLFAPMGAFVLAAQGGPSGFGFSADAASLVGYDLASAIVAKAPNTQFSGQMLPVPNGFLALTPVGSEPVELTFTAGLGSVAIPEPPSLALAGTGVLALAGVARRRRRRSP